MVNVTKPKVKKKPSGESGGWNEWLCTFEIGEHRYCDTKLETYEDDRNRAMGQRGTQRSPLVRDMKFSVNLLTAVGLTQKGDVRFLLCVTRTE